MPSNLSRRLNNNSSHRRNSSSPRNRCLAEAITATRWSIRTLKGRRYQQRSSLALPFALTVDKCIQVTRPILSLMHHPCNSDSHADPKRCVSILEINGMFQWLTASRQPKKIQLVSHVSSVIACHFFVFHRRIWKQPMPLSRKIQLMSRREEIYLVEWEAWPPPLVPEETKVVRLSHAFQDDWNSGFVYIFHFLLSIFLFFFKFQWIVYAAVDPSALFFATSRIEWVVPKTAPDPSTPIRSVKIRSVEMASGLYLPIGPDPAISWWFQVFLQPLETSVRPDQVSVKCQPQATHPPELSWTKLQPWSWKQ